MPANTPELNELFELLHARLHRLATRAMAGERKDHTLQPTALLHEAWLRLVRTKDNSIGPDTSPAQVLHAAARAMRQVLVDHARRRGAQKRVGRRRRVPLDNLLDRCAEHRLDAQELHDSLEALAQVHERPATVITLRFLAELTVKEVAELLDVSEGTVESDYRLARAYLRRQLNETP
jgi:RNA polymerase sigma factor (TIGR02999 family)